MKTKLFERIGHRVVLTEAGQAFLPHTRTIYTEWQNATHKIANFSQTVCGTLTIGCNNHIATHRLPNLIKIYKNKFPDVDYNFIFRTSSEIIDLVINHERKRRYLGRYFAHPMMQNRRAKRDDYKPSAVRVTQRYVP
ncbi:HTH-type transcriptional regulator GltC [Piscirickettsia salmonis]|nr:HTH-type transcriptional regulator GltC [Piscirickettsia salmonis]